MSHPLVVWWRSPAAPPQPDAARAHVVGWTDSTGRPYGQICLLSHHLRLDHGTIERALLERLADQYPVSPRLCAAGRMVEAVSVEAQLRITGHSVVEDDLHSRYGLDLIGHVTARLLGRGPEATVVVEQTLGDRLRETLLGRAAEDIDRFGRADPEELFDVGWQRVGTDDWRIAYAQP